MKKRFLNVALLSLLTVSMPMSFSSCKDYDDDITEINGTTDGLSDQIKKLDDAIQANKTAAADAATAAEAARKAAADAQKAGDDAMAQANAAMAKAKDAEAAAAAAKADALAEIKSQCEALQSLISSNSSAIKANESAIAQLIGRIEGVEKGLADVDIKALADKFETLDKQLSEQITESAKALEAIKVQADALEKYKQALDANYNELKSSIEGVSEDIEAAQTAIAAAQADLKAAQDQITELKGKIDAANAATAENTEAIKGINKILEGLNETISYAIDEAVSTLSGVLSERLTSLTLIPDLYIGGIPSVEFSSIDYNALTWNNSTKKWVAAAKNTIISNGQTEFRYRMNPSNVTAKGVKLSAAEFVSNIATARSVEEPTSLIKVNSATIGANGILTVKAAKGNVESLNLAGNKINTVSLKMPIAEEFWFAGETNPAVYSEFVRIQETYNVAKIHETAIVKTDAPHFFTYSEIYASAMNTDISATVKYNAELDLNTLVQVCITPQGETEDVDKPTVLTADEMALYNLAFEFSISEDPYILTGDKTNQQDFAKISGSTLTPKLADGTTGNQASIGKEPIVLVKLIDTANKNVVDATYFKVKITPEDVVDVTETVHTPFAKDLGCGTITAEITWKDMSLNLLKVLNGGKGMSEEDFAAIYGKVNPTIKITPDLGTVVATLNPGDVATPVLSYSVNAADLPLIKQGETKEVKVSVTYTNPDAVYGTVTAEFVVNITNNIVTPTWANDNLGAQWYNNGLDIDITPVPYPGAGNGATAEYDTNILLGRKSPYVTGALTCSKWAMYLANTAHNNDLKLNGNTANDAIDWMTLEAGNKLTSYNFTIDNNALGIAAVQNKDVVVVNVSSQLNGETSGSTVNIGKMNLHIQRPLKLDVTFNKSLTDDSYAQTLNIENSFTLHDWAGNLVAETATAPAGQGVAPNALWAYYVVEKPVFGTNLMICSDANGSNAVAPATYNMTAEFNAASGELKFQNAGAPIKNTIYIQIPVSVKHKWGELTGNIYVPVKSKGAIQTR